MTNLRQFALKNNHVVIVVALTAIAYGAASTAHGKDPATHWNVPPVKYNPDYPGAGRTGTANYNKLQRPTGKQRINRTQLYDNQGNVLGIAKAGLIGYYGRRRYGGINAGATTKVKIDGKDRVVTFIAAAPTVGGGSQSGYVIHWELSGAKRILQLQQQVIARMRSLYPTNDGRSYTKMIVNDNTLPFEHAEYYVDPDRDSSYTAGKAKYYYTRDGVLDGLINIPETGKQRFGVSCDQAPIGETFWMDDNIEEAVVAYYAPSSEVVAGRFRLVYGYFVTSAGAKRFCWTNRECLNVGE